MTRDFYFLELMTRDSDAHSLFAWLISHQPAVLFSQNKPAISNQPAVLFSQTKSARAISHQPNEQAKLRTFGLNHLRKKNTHIFVKRKIGEVEKQRFQRAKAHHDHGLMAQLA
jgi:hypothetical protein